MMYYLILQHEWPLNTKLKKPVPKDHMMYESIYMKSPEQENLQRQKKISDCLGLGGGVRGREWDTIFKKCFFLAWWRYSKIDCEYTKNHWLNWWIVWCVNYILINLLLFFKDEVKCNKLYPKRETDH